MSFVDSIKVCLTKYADFKGRASRPEFWWFFLATFLATALASAISDTLGTIVTFGLLLPSISVMVRRLSDAGYHWGMVFLNLIPLVGSIIVLILCAQASKAEDFSQYDTPYPTNGFSANPQPTTNPQPGANPYQPGVDNGWDAPKN